jgi:hypothetical protein
VIQALIALQVCKMGEMTGTDPTNITYAEAEVENLAVAYDKEENFNNGHSGVYNEVNGHKATDVETNGSGVKGGEKSNGHRAADGPGGKDGPRDSTLALERKKKSGKEKTKAVSLIQLFRYADRLDLLLLMFGILGSVATGVAQPLMTVLFGNLINAFGQNTDPHQLIHTISKVCTRVRCQGLFHFSPSIVSLMSCGNASEPRLHRSSISLS